jgi:small subunit ribosomal protein S16
MAVKIRLQRKGRKQAPFYHIVVADSRAPRDGRFIEKIGTYNPLTVPATIEISRDRAYYWLSVGAQPTDTANAILRFKGVLYMKHLMTGVAKGAITEESATEKLTAWIEQKEGSIASHREATAKSKADFKVKLDGIAKVKAKPAPVEEVVEAVEEEVAEAAAETTETVAAAVEHVEEVAAPVVEEVAASVVEEVAAPAEEAAPEAPAAETAE